MKCDRGSEGYKCMFDIESEGEEESGWKWRILRKIGEGNEKEREGDCIVLEMNVVDEGEVWGEENERNGESAGSGGMRGDSSCVTVSGIKEERVCEENCRAKEEFCGGMNVVVSGEAKERWVKDSGNMRKNVFEVGEEWGVIQGPLGGGVCVPMREG